MKTKPRGTRSAKGEVAYAAKKSRLLRLRVAVRHREGHQGKREEKGSAGKEERRKGSALDSGTLAGSREVCFVVRALGGAASGRAGRGEKFSAGSPESQIRKRKGVGKPASLAEAKGKPTLTC